MKYEVLVAGTVVSVKNTREEAEKRLEEAKNSYLSLVHPYDVFRIQEVDLKE